MRTTRHTVIILVLAAVSAACAPTGPTGPAPGRPALTAEIASKLVVGMGPDEVGSLIGLPDSVWSMTFGRDVGEPWEGAAWRYRGEIDRKFRHFPTRKVNTLYFYQAPSGRLLLNHWSLEAIAPAPPDR
jgi:hypothetical protein